jgi:hypothetical protein
MIGNIIKLPFWIVGKVLGAASGIIKLSVGIVFGVLKFALNHILGTVFGALAGLFLGRNHVGVKLFNHNKKKPYLKKIVR